MAVLNEEQARACMHKLLAAMSQEFARDFECNFAIAVQGLSRFRVKVFMQEHVGMVLVVGGTGSGKSTSMAAMIDHRNRTSAGHIITIEDPVESAYQSKTSLITNREVGMDTHSWHHALTNTLRQDQRRKELEEAQFARKREKRNVHEVDESLATPLSSRAADR